MKSMIDIAKHELYKDMPTNGIYVDLLMGSGFESLEMAKYADKGILYGFGGGESIENVCKLFETAELDNVRLINDTPDNLEVYLLGKINGAICRIHDDSTIDRNKLLKGLYLTVKNLKQGGRTLVLMQSREKTILDYLEYLPYREYDIMILSCPNDKRSAIAAIIEKL